MNLRRLTCSFLIVLYSLSVCSEQVSIVVDDYVPYIDKAKENKGFMTEIVTRSFEKVGVKSVLLFRPWKRIEQVEIDRNDRLSFSWIWNKERGERWLFSESIMSQTTTFISRKDNLIALNSIKDLKSYKTGITRGYSYGDVFDEFLSQLTVQIENSDEMNIKKVLANRIDIFPIDPYVAEGIILGMSGINRNELIFNPAPFFGVEGMYVICSKKFDLCQGYLDKFNKGLKILQQDGSAKAIIDKALGRD